MTIEARLANQDGDLRREQRAGGSQLTILHLCADIGSDSRYYDLDSKYKVLRIGKDIGVEKYTPSIDVHGIIANPVCTDFSTANYNRERDEDRGMLLVNHCLRIIEMANPKWWVNDTAVSAIRKDAGGYRFTYMSTATSFYDKQSSCQASHERKAKSNCPWVWPFRPGGLF